MGSKFKLITQKNDVFEIIVLHLDDKVESIRYCL